MRCLSAGAVFVIIFVFLAVRSTAAEIPPKPARYFNDFANLVRPETAQRLNQQLANFERQTSNQILVVIYPSLPPDTALEDLTQDAFRAWLGSSPKRRPASPSECRGGMFSLGSSIVPDSATDAGLVP